MQKTPTTPALISPLPKDFFAQDARELAVDLLGKVIRSRIEGQWLAARIIETEAYLLEEKGSHSSLGYTHARRALFMEAGTIYMYYARGGDSINFSAEGKGCGVLIKSAYPVTDHLSDSRSFAQMQQLNPNRDGSLRAENRLCRGQTLLCRALGIKVPDWNANQFSSERLFVEDDGYRPEAIVQAQRLGIPKGRDEALPYRFVDAAFAEHCTRNPLGRTRQPERDYRLLTLQQAKLSAVSGATFAG